MRHFLLLGALSCALSSMSGCVQEAAEGGADAAIADVAIGAEAAIDAAGPAWPCNDAGLRTPLPGECEVVREVDRTSENTHGIVWCFTPPDYNCGSTQQGVVTFACAPDRSVCCSFATTCIPCGWDKISPRERWTWDVTEICHPMCGRPDCPGDPEVELPPTGEWPPDSGP